MMNRGKNGHIEILTISPETSLIEEIENTLCYFDRGAEALRIGEEKMFPRDSILVKNKERIELINDSQLEAILIKVVMSDLGR